MEGKEISDTILLKIHISQLEDYLALDDKYVYYYVRNTDYGGGYSCRGISMSRLQGHLEGIKTGFEVVCPTIMNGDMSQILKLINGIPPGRKLGYFPNKKVVPLSREQLYELLHNLSYGQYYSCLLE